MSIKTITFSISCFILASCGSTQKNVSVTDKKAERFLNGEVYLTQDFPTEDSKENQTDTFYIYKENGIADRYWNGFVRIINSKGIGYTNYGYDSKKPVFTIKPQYKAASQFKGKYAVVAVFSTENTVQSSTDEAADVFTLTGSEKWGVIDNNGNTIKDFVYTRKWDDKIKNYIYVSPTNTFWINDKGEIKGF